MLAYGLFVPGNSAIHRLHPLTRLVAALAITIAGFALPWLWAPTLLWLVTVLPIALLAGTARSLLILLLRVLLPITISVFLIQSFLYPVANPTLLRFGPLTLRQEGIQFATLVSSRLLVATSATAVVLFTTHPADLVLALTEQGMPRSFGYILLVSLQLLPTMQGRATAILEAQRSRGLETQGSLLQRVRGLVPLAGPLVIGALSEVEERAIALELRGFMNHGPRTSLRTLHDSRSQHIARRLLLVGTLALVMWRVMLTLNT